MLRLGAACGLQAPRPPGADRARVARPEPAARSPRRCPADQSTVHGPRETVSQEEHQARRFTTPELPVDRQAQRVPIKPVASLRVGRMKQDPAPKDFHVLHPALEVMHFARAVCFECRIAQGILCSHRLIRDEQALSGKKPLARFRREMYSDEKWAAQPWAFQDDADPAPG